MDNWAAEEAARLILEAWRANSRIDNLPQECRPKTRREGYRVQAEIARLSGQNVSGWKIAATSQAGQKHIGVDGPLAGRLLERRVFHSGDAVPMVNSLMKVAEVEFAFRMERDLSPRSSAYTVTEVMGAVDTLHPAIEIPDSRYRDFARVGAAQLIADNACANYFVLGPAANVDWREINLVEHAASAYLNGELAGEGKGANVLGDPRIALAWLANELSESGETLRKGHVVTTGTCLIPVEIHPGDTIVADFGSIGKVEARMMT